MATGLVRANEIGRLKVQGGHNEAVALRLRLSQLLGSANLTPPGLAPTAVLIVRQLSDPLPGRLAVRQTPTGNRAWEEATRRHLAILYRQAARPVRGVVPGWATAVCFSDEAEMLACLALALNRGRPVADWWWQLILRRLPGHRTVGLFHLLAGQPRLLPAVCYYLASWGQSTAVLQKLSPEQAQTLLASLAQAHALPAPHFWQSATAAVDLTEQEGALTYGARPVSGLVPARAVTPATTPPWRDWLPAAQLPSHLGPERRCLLAIALSLHRRPTAVYSQTFWQKMGHWWRGEKLATDGQRAVPKQHTPEPNYRTPEPVVTSAEQVGSTAVSAPQTTILPPQAQPTPAPEANKGWLATAPTASPNIESPTRSLETVAESLSPGQPAADQGPTEWAAAGILTQIGGLFYLINVMQRLDIPGCYEADWGLAAQVGGWGVLDLLTRGLLGPDQAHLAADPVWAALAAIDGRSVGELPGEQYPVSGKQHPVSAEQLVASPLLAGLNPALGGWLAVALPPVRAYLQQVLQLSNPAEIGPRLLLVNGRIHISATHIDLVLGLEAIALPVRLAGLDINPGWVPTLGRVIQFHFQEAMT